jgi:hypothetical protein
MNSSTMREVVNPTPCPILHTVRNLTRPYHFSTFQLDYSTMSNERNCMTPQKSSAYYAIEASFRIHKWEVSIPKERERKMG